MATHDAAPAHAPASNRSKTRGWRGSTQRSIFAWSYVQNLTPLSGITCNQWQLQALKAITPLSGITCAHHGAQSCPSQCPSVAISGHRRPFPATLVAI